MPQPIIIKEPPTDLVESTAEVGTKPPDNETSRSARARTQRISALWLTTGTLRIAARIAWSITTAGARIAQRYPRHSLAAAASLLILGAVWLSQHHSGNSVRQPVINQITGVASGASTVDRKNTAGRIRQTLE